MTFRQFLAILLARKTLFVAVLLAVLLPALAVSLWLDKQYTAVASVVIDAKPDPLSAMAFQTMTSPAVMATQVDIILSDRVARRVVRMLKLSENPQIREQWTSATKGVGDIETWLVERLQKELDVKPSRESSVINISFRAPDARFAAGMANAFVQAYIETAVDLRVDPAKQYSAFFETRAKEARETLEAAQTRLSAFQRETGVLMTDERMDVENQRLNELSSQLVVLQSMAAEATSRQAQATAGSGDKLQEVSSNPVVSTLRADLSRQEARLKEISSRLGDSNPQVVELKANISELRQRIDSEVGRLSAGVGVSGSISRQREAQTRAELEAQRNKVLRMKQVRDEAALIQRDVEIAQKNYDAIVQRFTQSSLESQATSSSASLLNSAVPPLEHSSPKVLLNTLLALVVGLLLGTGVVLGAELRDRRVRDVADVEGLLGLPLIGFLPGPDAGGAAGRRADSAMHRRLIGPAPSSKNAG
ncbi:chain length determinant protein EpsF [Roseateles sp.]|jgi:succinoglycan biosynthesis transport protein ExoP|uniref:chain length determinant protein EpsF n=1 Tax=Roseateles sp. TaxID=1971397 RepID=UPI0037C86765